MATKAARKTKSKGGAKAPAEQTRMDDLYTEEGITSRGAAKVSPPAGKASEIQPETDAPGQTEPEAATASEDKPAAALPSEDEQPPQGPADTVEERHLRLRAEFDNYIKRTGREKRELAAYSGLAMVRALLPVLDDLNRTVAHAREAHHDSADPLLQGVEMVLDKFTRLLEAEGVQPIEALGKPFDPLLHEAMLRRESADHPEGTVLEEFETGYLYRDRVIRHAKVVVSG